MKKSLVIAFTTAAGMISVTAHAVPLTSAYVVEVKSAKVGTERLNAHSTSKQYDHGGPTMTIVTDEFGYGQHAQATLLGSPLKEIGSVPLCNQRGVAAPCNGRGSVIGYRRTWDASGREGGNFQFVVYATNGSGGNAQRVNLQIR